MILVSVLAAFLLPPVPAAKVAARLFDVPERDLVAVTLRESQGQRIGIHSLDRWASPRACKKARNRELLAQDVVCVGHLGGWSTRGAFGLMAAYNLHWLGLDRWPWVLDVPFVSAAAAARRYAALCPGDRWCPG